ncbi:hypothetical protein KZJ38_26955 [Paraburkholderia edwinii]|uniref:Uncharacterized protein n=1 Tax=Paraburkholderia edwinii TaxID=2861782 RepID=A0ABX8V1D9_9BURK|nr:hypothetical protein [Paraburkholderia edwinii]QYD73280.1 hypothetical protein KZJ38_26955 [Paraburkholderia edwinii]
MEKTTRETRLAALSRVCCACALIATMLPLVPASALAQAANGNQNRRGGASSLRLSSPGGMGLSSGGGIGRSSGLSAGGSSSGFGGHAGSAPGSGGAGSQSLGGMTGSHAGSSSSGLGASGGKSPKLKLKPASEASAGSAPHSFYDYAYGSDQIGRNSDSLYKSPTDVPPTANYRFGATDTQ